MSRAKVLIKKVDTCNKKLQKIPRRGVNECSKTIYLKCKFCGFKNTIKSDLRNHIIYHHADQYKSKIDLIDRDLRAISRSAMMDSGNIINIFVVNFNFLKNHAFRSLWTDQV